MNLAQQLRVGLREATASLDQAQSSPDDLPVFTYVPPSHARALDLDATLVEGIRGAGKTFWCSQLATISHREFVQTAFPETRLPQNLRIARGFGIGLTQKDAPSADVLAELIVLYRPRSIWRAVIAVHAGFQGGFALLSDWNTRVRWVQEHAEEFDTYLEHIDRAMDDKGQTLLVLFDALDRLADSWQSINPLAKALLQVALELRSTRRIRCKVFVRPDILQESAITGFPDYSKLLAGKADLRWKRADLYALLFQRLANSMTGGGPFRALIFDTIQIVLKQQSADWVLPSALRSDEKLQEQLVEQLAGKAMGGGINRGKPYTWLVNHLQDGLDQVSPRSFFAALKHAAAETSEDHALALDYRKIQTGVQSASQIRVAEIEEDYPWVQHVMAPLRGKLTVPCSAKEFEDMWSEKNTLSELAFDVGFEVVKLPPKNIDRQSDGVLSDLASLGMVRRMEDGRIQMPDVYRLAFGLGRHGGTKPLK